MLHSFLYCFILIQLFFVSLVDIRHRKISNQWIYLNIVLFLGFLFIFPQEYSLTTAKLLYSFAFIVVGFILFLMNLMGAGDSKYLFSIFLLIPPQWSDYVLYSLFLCTMTIGGFSLLITIVKNFEKLIIFARLGHRQGIRECLGSKFPFAPVILMSWLLFGAHLYLLR